MRTRFKIIRYKSPSIIAQRRIEIPDDIMVVIVMVVSGDGLLEIDMKMVLII